MKFIFIGIIVPLCVLIPIISGIVLYRYFSRVEKALLILLFLNGICNLVGSLLAYNKINNLPVIHVYTFLEGIVLMLFFLFLFNTPLLTKILYTLIIVFSAFCLLNSIFIQQIFAYNTYSRTLEALIIIALCLYYFTLQLQEDFQPGKYPGFWYVLGLFIYFSSSLTIFILSNQSFNLNRTFLLVMWNVHAGMLLLMYLFISKGFMLCRK
ncbi:MAG: hypothetical protein JST81_01710 [Bacteroidetes bacterium]|nr:hypothetical protein [Bacteroidota bacterium]